MSTTRVTTTTASSPAHKSIAALFEELSFSSDQARTVSIVLLDGLPLTSVGADVKRVTTSEISRKLRQSSCVPALSLDELGTLLTYLLDNGVLVGKRDVGGQDTRYSLTAHPERIQDERFRKIAETALEDRARRAPPAFKPSAPVIVHGGAGNSIDSAYPSPDPAHAQTKLKKAAERKIAPLSSALREIISSADLFYSACYLNEIFSQLSVEGFSFDSCDLTSAQVTLVAEWTGALDAQYGSTIPLPGAGIKLDIWCDNGVTEPRFVHSDSVEEWLRQTVRPHIRKAEQRLITIRSSLTQLLQLTEQLAGTGAFPAELADSIRSNLSGFIARANMPPHASVLRSIIDPLAEEPIKAVAGVAMLCRALGLPEEAPTLSEFFEERREKEKQRHTKIVETAEQCCSDLERFMDIGPELQRRGEIFATIVASRVRPAEQFAAEQWDNLQAEKARALRDEFGRFPRLGVLWHPLRQRIIGGRVALPAALVLRLASERWLKRKMEAAAQAVAERLEDPLEGITTLSSLLREAPIMRPPVIEVVKAHQARIQQINVDETADKNRGNIEAIWAEMKAYARQIRDLHLPEKPAI